MIVVAGAVVEAPEHQVEHLAVKLNDGIAVIHSYSSCLKLPVTPVWCWAQPWGGAQAAPQLIWSTLICQTRSNEAPDVVMTISGCESVMCVVNTLSHHLIIISSVPTDLDYNQPQDRDAGPCCIRRLSEDSGLLV